MAPEVVALERHHARVRIESAMRALEQHDGVPAPKWRATERELYVFEVLARLSEAVVHDLGIDELPDAEGAPTTSAAAD